MTAMPELVALLNAFGGLAAVLVGVSSYMAPGDAILTSAEQIVHHIEICGGVAIGSVTFFGSVVAWAKLGGRLSGKALQLPFRHAINVALTAVGVALIVLVMRAETSELGLQYLLLLTGLTGFLGIHLVLSIGGADMPVVVSLLNSYSGWAASAAGFMLQNDLLIITGALVGIERRDPLDHYVPRDEPVVGQCALRRIWRHHLKRARQ